MTRQIECLVMQGRSEIMRYIHLFVAAFCTFAALISFDGTVPDALNGALAVLNLGLYLRA